MINNRKKDVTKRLTIINGHLRRVQKMVNENIYCIDILNQSLAVQRALKKVDGIILDNHLHSCVRDALITRGKKSEKAVKELLEIYERSTH